ncbi:MAG TPA: hypothetical protein VFL96_07265, partial [Acidobacteriaceae bacterium]|nr:hypothetical protein [Acidobacteriaceae bacterium]
VGRIPVPESARWGARQYGSDHAGARGMRAMQGAAVQHEPEIRNQDAESKRGRHVAGASPRPALFRSALRQ